MLAWCQSKHIKRASILTVIFAALLLAGCVNAQSNVALYGNGQWSGAQAMTLSAEFVELMESEGQAGGELTTDTESLDEWIQQAQNAGARNDLKVSFYQALPSSGGVLSEAGSAMPFILGGLILIALVGAGIIASIQHKK